MATFIGAFPVLPGKDDDVRKFAQETMGRSEEFSASQKRSGVTKEEWAFQQSPMGSLVLVHFEANDIEKSFAALAQSSDRKSTRLNSSHTVISYAVFCLKKKKKYNSQKYE